MTDIYEYMQLLDDGLHYIKAVVTWVGPTTRRIDNVLEDVVVSGPRIRDNQSSVVIRKIDLSGYDRDNVLHKLAYMMALRVKAKPLGNMWCNPYYTHMAMAVHGVITVDMDVEEACRIILRADDAYFKKLGTTYPLMGNEDAIVKDDGGNEVSRWALFKPMARAVFRALTPDDEFVAMLTQASMRIRERHRAEQALIPAMVKERLAGIPREQFVTSDAPLETSLLERLAGMALYTSNFAEPISEKQLITPCACMGNLRPSDPGCACEMRTMLRGNMNQVALFLKDNTDFDPGEDDE